MSELLAKFLKWLWNNLVVLLIIVLILIIAGWVKAEAGKVRKKWVEAERSEQLADRLSGELALLIGRREQLKGVSAELGERLRSCDLLRRVAGVAEQRAKETLVTIESEKGWYFTRYTHTEYFLKYEAAVKSHEAAKAVAKTADKEWVEIGNLLKESLVGQELVRLQQQIDLRGEEIDNLRQTAKRHLDEVARSPLQRVKIEAMEVIPVALTVLACIIVVPVLIKAFLYWCVAPFVRRADPVRLFPEANGEINVAPSAISVPVTLEPGDEILVHSSYLQASGAGPGKQTRWLFSWRMPLTSLAAGLYAMVSVRNDKREATCITLAPKRDLFDQLVDIKISSGGSLVIYPRSLVAMVLKGGIRPEMCRRWKFGNLHSWITFQFRYLIIHGECRILIKGCRGVRAECVSISEPRMQDQGATLGFSANLAYSAERCETFADYLFGRDELFNDKFSAADGIFLTEEVADPRRKKIGLFGRGLEGVIDGLLKAFGI